MSFQSWVGPAIEGSGDLITLGGRHADKLWGYNREIPQFAGNRYLGGNPMMAGRYQGEFANMDATTGFYTQRHKPKFTEWAEKMGPITKMVGQGLQMKPMTASEELFKDQKNNYGGYQMTPPAKYDRGTEAYFNTRTGMNSYYEPIQIGLPYDTAPNNFQMRGGTAPTLNYPEYNPSFGGLNAGFGGYGMNGNGLGGFKSGIHIKPSRRGSFTKWCKQHGYGGVTSECISAAKGKGGAMKKKAVFAQNAKGWKHAEEGLEVEPKYKNGKRVSVMPGYDDNMEFPEQFKYWERNLDLLKRINQGLEGGLIVHALNNTEQFWKELDRKGFLDGPQERREYFRKLEEDKQWYDSLQRPNPLLTNPKPMAKGGHVVEEVDGISPNKDTEPYNLNGVPALLADGEKIYRMDDGSIAVLNEDQQKMLAYKPLKDVVKNLPKVSSMAKDGTVIPPTMMERYLNEENVPWEYENGYPLKDIEIIGRRSPFRMESIPSGELIMKLPYDELKNTPEDAWRKGWERDRGSALGGNTSFTDQYKQLARMQGYSSLGSSLAEAGTNLAMYLMNEKEPPPEDIARSRPAWNNFVPINPEPALRAIKASSRSAMSMANQMGKTELITPIASQTNDAITKLYSEVEGLNSQSRNAFSQQNAQATMENNKLDMAIQMQNLQNRFNWDVAMAGAQQNNLTEMFGAFREGSKAIGTAGNNILSADIVDYLIRTGNINTLLERYGLA